MNYQPNSDDAHDHTYPVQAEGLHWVGVDPFSDRISRRVTALEAEVQALRNSLTHTDALLHRYINRNEGN